MGDSTFPHLSTVLTDGTFPADDDAVRDTLADALVELATAWPDDDPADRAELFRYLARGGDTRPFSTDPAEPAPETRRRACSWAADLFERPDLAVELLDSLDPLTRLDVEQTIDRVLHAHPIYVGPRGDGPEPGARWQCDACGSHHTNEEVAFVVGHRPGYSDLPVLVTYCPACIRIAADALDSEV